MFINMKVLISLFVFALIVTIVTNNTFFVYGQNSNPNVFENIFNNLKNKIIDLTNSVEYTIDIKADQIFLNDTIKNSVLNKNEPTEYLIPILEYNLIGFDIFATDIKVRTESSTIDDAKKDKLRIEFPIMQAKNVNVKNEIFDLNYENIDLSSTYTIYDSELDKFTIHIPVYVAARYLPK
jgi:hypothetical protein